MGRLPSLGRGFFRSGKKARARLERLKECWRQLGPRTKECEPAHNPGSEGKIGRKGNGRSEYNQIRRSIDLETIQNVKQLKRQGKATVSKATNANGALRLSRRGQWEKEKEMPVVPLLLYNNNNELEVSMRCQDR